MKYLRINATERLEKFSTLFMSPEEIVVLHMLEIMQAVSEKPLPLDGERLLKLVGRRTKKYKEALALVLTYFFEETDDGYVPLERLIVEEGEE